MNTMRSNLQVAETIQLQLGGSRFELMTGSHSFVGDVNYLSFQVGRNPKGVTHVRVTLDADDTYTVTFFKFNRRTLELKMLASVDGVYADQLRATFTMHTGLLTSL